MPAAASRQPGGISIFIGGMIRFFLLGLGLGFLAVGFLAIVSAFVLPLPSISTARRLWGVFLFDFLFDLGFDLVDLGFGFWVIMSTPFFYFDHPATV